MTKIIKFLKILHIPPLQIAAFLPFTNLTVQVKQWALNKKVNKNREKKEHKMRWVKMDFIYRKKHKDR